MKRVVDLALAILGLVVAVPIGLLIAAAIKLDSPGPVFFVQDRVGRDQKTFRCFKFRTMLHDVEGAAWTEDDDPRVTPVGGAMRALHLDELPQLLNVLCGEMSIVGPRPLVEGEVVLFGALEPPYNARFAVRPGITGLAQVSVSRDDHQAKFRLDAFYVAHQSLRLDLVIMLRTIARLLRLSAAYARLARRMRRRQVAERAL